MKSKHLLSLSRLLKPSQKYLLQYRMIKKNIFSNINDAQKLVIMTTTPTFDEMHSDFSMNLALDIALDGQKTLLIDADIENQILTNFLDCDNSPGLIEAVTSLSQDVSINIKETSVENLHFLPVGSLTNRKVFRRSERLASFMAQLKTIYDVIVIDASPILSSNEMQYISVQADMCILIVEDGLTKTQSFDATLNFMALLEDTVLASVILN